MTPHRHREIRGYLPALSTVLNLLFPEPMWHDLQNLSGSWTTPGEMFVVCELGLRSLMEFKTDSVPGPGSDERY